MPPCAWVDFQASHRYVKLEVGLRPVVWPYQLVMFFPSGGKKLHPVTFKVCNLISSVIWVCLNGALYLGRGCCSGRAGRGVGLSSR